MNRIMVVGNCGVGKSTFSKQLGTITGLEVIHLDTYYWKPNWVEPDKKEWKLQVELLASQPRWIIDGNYGGTMDIRLNRADTIIFLNYPVRIALWRVFKRIKKYRGRVRPDMPEGCKERFDFEFLLYVFSFNHRRKGQLLKKLSHLNNEKQVLVMKTDSDVDEFLKSLVFQSISNETQAY